MVSIGGSDSFIMRISMQWVTHRSITRLIERAKVNL